MIQSKKWQVPFYVLMSALSLTMIFPFLWMVSTSFKFDTQVFTVPVEWIPDPVNLSNYTQVWVEEPFLLYYKYGSGSSICHSGSGDYQRNGGLCILIY